MQLFKNVSISLLYQITQNKTFMELFSNLLLAIQLVLFCLFMGNVGNLIIHLLIDKDANS